MRRLPFLGKSDQLIEHRAAYTRLEPVADQDIGCGGIAQLGVPHGALVDTERKLPAAQQYDYVFDGDSEGLSGLLASPALYQAQAFAGPVHINADFAGQTSDHDPLLAYINGPR